MFIPATNIPATIWASANFRVTVSFDQPTPTFSVDVIEEATRGMRFVEFDQSTPPRLVARFELDVPLEQDERLPVFNIQGLHVTPISPFMPITVAKNPVGPDASSIYDQIIFAGDPPPPQFSPAVVVIYHVVLWRILPA